MLTQLDATTLLLLKSNQLQLESTQDKSVQIDSTRHDEIDLTRLWHERTRHIGEKGIQDMQRKGIVKGFPECGLEFDFCEHVIFIFVLFNFFLCIYVLIILINLFLISSKMAVIFSIVVFMT